jgi:hypothetical protein
VGSFDNRPDFDNFMREIWRGMSRKFKISLSWMTFFFLLNIIPMNAQLLQDTATLHLVRQEVDHIYNFEFEKARGEYARIVQLYPAHPIVSLLRGLMTYWENYPMLRTSPAHTSFEEDMHECINLAEKNTETAYEAEYLLANLCARGMLLMFYDDNDLIMEVTPLTISTYKYLRRAFSFASACSDLHYFTGTYDYYREAYPRAYPVYKSLAFLFPHGNMDRGLKELQTAAVSSIVLGAESNFLLTWIYLSFENKLPESTSFCRALHEKYRSNPLYSSLYIRNLLLMKDYDQADRLLKDTGGGVTNRFFEAQTLILTGILYEKKYHNNKIAEQYYHNGINEITVYGKFGNEYAAYAYFGLSRISDDNGEKHTRKIYRKEALKLADFKKITFDK